MNWGTDPKAERITAEGQAAVSEAQAAAILAQAAREDRAAEGERDDRRAEREEERREKRRVEREERRGKRRAGRAVRREKVIGAARRYAVPVVSIGAPEIIAWSGQYGFAKTSMQLGAWTLAPLLPVALEGGALYSAKLALDAIEAGKPAGKYRFATWVQAGIAAGMNYTHGAATGGPHATQVGIAYALTSLLGITMLELTVAHKKHKASDQTAEEIRASLVRWLRYPLLSVQASAIGAARHLDAVAAWRAAWVDRYGIGPDSTRHERRAARAVMSRQRRWARKAARKGVLAVVDGALVERSDRPDAERAGEAAHPISPRVGFVDDLEQMLRAAAEAPGTTLDLFGGPHERSHSERMSAHDDDPASGSGRSDGDEVSGETERSPDAEVSGSERSVPAGSERSPNGELSGGKRSPGDETERSGGEEVSGKRKRSTSRLGGKVSGRRDKKKRLAAIQELLATNPDMKSPAIAKQTGIGESTVRRLVNELKSEPNEN